MVSGRLCPKAALILISTRLRRLGTATHGWSRGKKDDRALQADGRLTIIQGKINEVERNPFCAVESQQARQAIMAEPMGPGAARMAY